MMNTQDFETLGSFYLGRGYDLKQGKLSDRLTLYDSKDLVTHGVVLGMTGSGKTGLCLSILEEAAMDNIPAIIIDPKGDIANLMLTFPDFKGSDFLPWINEDDARKKNLSPDDYAEQTARKWEQGIGDWGQSPERVRTFQNRVDINIFTPGSKAGIPVSILSSLEAPSFEVLDDGELLGDRIESTVSSLLSLLGEDADPIQSPEAILLGSLFSHCWKREENLSLESIIRYLQKPPFDTVGVIDLESFMSTKDRQKLALKFNALLASPSFSTWLEGPALDIDSMMHAPDGKPRISIFSIAHLSDSERMFFVSLLFNQMLSWMRAQNGTTSLRALLYMDEIYGYLPPTQNPPSKKPLMTMLKQGRAFGLGVLLATQNPVDLDYKALSNIGTWWLGRLQTERDKARVLDGLEGAAASQDGSFDRAEMEQLLAGLGARVFLMNNVHESGPETFHVRWVMSYLCGPLTRRKIKQLMDPKRHLFDISETNTSTLPPNPMAMPEKGKTPAPASRPVVGTGVTEYFLPVSKEATQVGYQPALLREAKVHYSSSKYHLDSTHTVRTCNPMLDDAIDWDHPLNVPHPTAAMDSSPEENATFAPLSGYAMNASNYKQVKKDFANHIYHHERIEIFHCPLLNSYSHLGESEGAFRGRMAQHARELRDQAVEKLRDKYAGKIRTKVNQRERAEHTLAREEAESSSANWQTGAKILGGLLGGLFGGRRSSASTTINSATRAYKQRSDVKLAEKKIAAIQEDIDDLESELAEEIETLDSRFDPTLVELETVKVKPYKKNIHVSCTALLWLPYDEEGVALWC